MEALDPLFRSVAAGVCYTLAYAAGIVLFALMARRRGLATEGIRALMFAGLAGGLSGAVLAHLLVTGTPGKSLLGGIAGGYLAVVATKRGLGIVRPTGDLFAVAIAGGEAIGRLGCFFGGCCFGKMTSLPWAVYDHGEWRHPTQLYLALAAAMTFAVLVAVERRRTLPENGLFWLQGTLLCATRFAIEPLRDVAPVALGLTAAQIATVVGLAYFAARLCRMLRGSWRVVVPRTA